MAVFPKIQSPCPYKSQLAAVMEGDFCRMCSRHVYDLTAWSDEERMAFLGGCREEVCVSYRLPVRGAVAAAALAAASVAMPAAAASPDEEFVTIVVGGIKDPGRVEYVRDSADAQLPELPVVYEEEKEAPPPAKAQKPAA